MINTERLQEIRDALKIMGYPDNDAAWYKDNASHINTMIETFRDLDESLTQGGYFPTQWGESTSF